MQRNDARRYDKCQIASAIGLNGYFVGIAKAVDYDGGHVYGNRCFGDIRVRLDARRFNSESLLRTAEKPGPRLS